MKVASVEVLDEGAAASLCRLARKERREERDRISRMNMYDVMNLFSAGLSAFREHVASPQYCSVEESPLPPVANDQVGKNEEPDAIALLEFARASAFMPVLVQFSWRPSKASVSRFRRAAKVRNCTLYFSYLIENYALIKVRPEETPGESDEDILKSLRVSW